MTDTPETLADIVRAMRNPPEDGTPGYYDDSLKIWADRIEASAERERAITDIMLAAKGKPLPHPDPENAPPMYPVNAAAMRDLLEKILREYCDGLISCRTCVSSDADVERVSDLFEKQIDAALAAPARNCDRYATAKDALDAFIREKEIKEEDVDNMNLRDFFDWLFERAKGGAE